MRKKGRKIEDFSFFLNRKEDVRHAYDKYKTAYQKPDFDIAYNLVSKYAEGFLKPETNLIWVPSKQDWIEEKSF